MLNKMNVIGNEKDFVGPVAYVRYARVSTLDQCGRKADVQFRSIELAMKRRGENWRHVADCADGVDQPS